MSNAPKNLDTNSIRNMYLEGYCVNAIARKFKCRPNAITVHISDLIIPVLPKKRKCKLTAKDIKIIRKEYIQKRVPAPVLAERFNISESSVLGIIHGRCYRWVPGQIIDRYGVLKIIPKNNFVDKPINLKGALKPGPNEKTERMVNSGVAKEWAKKYKVSTSTISKWLRNGKLDLTGKKRC